MAPFLRGVTVPYFKSRASARGNFNRLNRYKTRLSNYKLPFTYSFLVLLVLGLLLPTPSFALRGQNSESLPTVEEIQAGMEEDFFISQSPILSQQFRDRLGLSPSLHDITYFLEEVLKPFQKRPAVRSGLLLSGAGYLSGRIDLSHSRGREVAQAVATDIIERSTSSEEIRQISRQVVEAFFIKAEHEGISGQPASHLSDNDAVEMLLELIRVTTGNNDPYSELKRVYNESALKHLELMETTVTQSGTPFETAISLGIIGNAIDFADATQRKRLEQAGFSFEEAIQRAAGLTYKKDQRSVFLEALKQSPDADVLFLADNAGEVVFDLPLIRLLLLQGRRVTLAGKSLPHINDMTKEDLANLFQDSRALNYLGEGRVKNQLRIISGGSNITGLDLRRISKEALELWDSDAIVYAKGQGMIETLRYVGVTRDLFHAVMVKNRGAFQERDDRGEPIDLARGDALFLNTQAADLEREELDRRLGRFFETYKGFVSSLHSRGDPVVQMELLDLFEASFGDLSLNPETLDHVYKRLLEHLPFSIHGADADQVRQSVFDQTFTGVDHLIEWIRRVRLSYKDAPHLVYLGDDGLLWAQAHRSLFHGGKGSPFSRYFLNRAMLLTQEEFHVLKEFSSKHSGFDDDMVLHEGLVITVMYRILREAIQSSSDQAGFDARAWDLFQRELVYGTIQKQLAAELGERITKHEGPWRSFYEPEEEKSGAIPEPWLGLYRAQQTILSDPNRNVFKEISLRIGRHFVRNVLDTVHDQAPISIVDMGRWGGQPFLLKNAVRYLTGKDRLECCFFVREQGSPYDGKNYPFILPRKAGTTAYLESLRPISFEWGESPNPEQPRVEIRSNEQQVRGLIFLFVAQAEAQKLKLVPITQEYARKHAKELTAMDTADPVWQEEGVWDESRWSMEQRPSTGTFLKDLFSLSFAFEDVSGKPVAYIYATNGQPDYPVTGPERYPGAFIFRLGVRQNWKGKQLGPKLLLASARAALAMGIGPNVSLETCEQNRHARHVYVSLGFKEVGQRREDRKDVTFIEYAVSVEKLIERAEAKIRGLHTAGMEEGRLEVAVHDHLLDAVRAKFRNLPNLTWRLVSTNSGTATEQLKDFVGQEGIRRVVILDELYISEWQVNFILPEGHAPAFMVNANSANQLTPEYITQLLRLPEVSAGGIYFLRFEKDRIQLEVQA